MDLFGLFAAATVGAIVWNVLFYGAMYVTMGLGLMKMAQKLGLPYPWLSWIPLANMFLVVKVAGEKKKNMGTVFLVFFFIAAGVYVMNLLINTFAWLDHGIFNGITGHIDGFPRFDWGWGIVSGLVGFILAGSAITAYVLWCILLYHIFKRFKPQNCKVFTVLSVIFAFLGPIFLLAASFGTPDQEPPAYQAAQAAGTPPQSGPKDPPYTPPPPQGPPTFTPPSPQGPPTFTPPSGS